MSDEEEPEMSLVMPFVVVQSNGGRYDDEAFAAGWLCGEIWRYLDLGKVPPSDIGIQEDLIPQIDLIAMHFGYTMRSEPTDIDGFYTLTYVKADDA